MNHQYGMKKVKTNLNHYIYVKLTKSGIEELRRQHLVMFGGNEDWPWKEPEVDEDGFSKWQAWDIISRLGKDCKPGFGQPFSTTIYFEYPEDSQ